MSRQKHTFSSPYDYFYHGDLPEKMIIKRHKKDFNRLERHKAKQETKQFKKGDAA